MHLAATSWRHRANAATALARGDFAAALREAEEANRLCRTKVGEEMVAVARAMRSH